jgi:hypothetical protein
VSSATYNQALLPPPHAYDLLRAQYPDLYLYASRGARYYDLLPALDQAALDLVARVAATLWLLIDRFIAASQATLVVDALVGLLHLRAAWLTLKLASAGRIARPQNTTATLAIDGGGASLLAATERDLAAAVTMSGHDWLARGSSLLRALSEG